MLTRTRIIALSLTLMMVLSACAGGAFGGIGSVTEAVDSQTITRDVQYYDRGDSGEMYTISLTVPEDWVGSYETINNGSVVTFNRIDDNGHAAKVFSLHALSFSQFWEQGGSYPGDYTNLKQLNDTYFVVYAPPIAFYSGLPEEEYQALIEIVEDVLTTFEVMPVEEMMM